MMWLFLDCRNARAEYYLRCRTSIENSVYKQGGKTTIQPPIPGVWI
ncbi:MAG: hypothetical protein ACI8P9_004108 [Parasphingorhabdus sp.]|jgi:hypothetical protein